jgi:hypothetical protein
MTSRPSSFSLATHLARRRISSVMALSFSIAQVDFTVAGPSTNAGSP